uniref:NADH-cytochrome b5 reductase n=1 Tax=Dracunculus medinensis TaxID=318479 RepID=A0A0N4U166_DRAME
LLRFIDCLLFQLITLKDHEEKYALPLISKKLINHDTRRFRFKLPSEKHSLGLPVGQHVFLSAKINGKLVVRPYTPVTSEDEKGYTELVVKVYFKDVNPRYPEGGKMSQHLDSLNVGDTVDFRGPNGLIIYKGRGKFAVRPSKAAIPVEHYYRELGMIAGGSGITPILQVVQAILKDSGDTTKMSLIFANKSEDDILLRKELDELAETHSTKFKVWYTVDNPPLDWKYSSGFISTEMIQAHFPKPSDTTAILLCGPPPMINHACLPKLDSLGYSSKNCFIF